jgi:hypothetical protein
MSGGLPPHEMPFTRKVQEMATLFDRHATRILAMLMASTMPTMMGNEPFEATKTLRPRAKTIRCRGDNDKIDLRWRLRR